jgi:hypothetical protein
MRMKKWIPMPRRCLSVVIRNDQLRWNVLCRRLQVMIGGIGKDGMDRVVNQQAECEGG